MSGLASVLSVILQSLEFEQQWNLNKLNILVPYLISSKNLNESKEKLWIILLFSTTFFNFLLLIFFFDTTYVLKYNFCIKIIHNLSKCDDNL